MSTIDKQGFIAYLRRQWTPAGYDVSEASDAPYRELFKAPADGFSFGLSLLRDGDGPSDKARLGVWFRPAPKGSIADLAPLRTHYQQKIQSQGRGCRIHNCATEAGSVFLFWETLSQLPEGAVSSWTQMVEELSGLCFDPEALESYLHDND